MVETRAMLYENHNDSIPRNAYLVLTTQPEPVTSGGMANATKRPGKKLAATRPVESLIHWRSQIVTSNSSANQR